MFGLIGAAISAVCSAIGGAIGAIGSALSAVCGALGAAVGKIAGMLGNIMAKVIAPILSVFGINIPEPEKPEKIGMKMAKSDKKLEDFDNIDEYIKHLEKVEIDDKELESLSPEKRLGYAIAGTSLGIKAVEDKTGVYISPESVPALGKIVEGTDFTLNGAQQVTVLKNLADAGIKDMSSVASYLEGSNEVDAVQIGSALNDALAAVDISDPSKVIMDCKRAQALEL